MTSERDVLSKTFACTMVTIETALRALVLALISWIGFTA